MAPKHKKIDSTTNQPDSGTERSVPGLPVQSQADISTLIEPYRKELLLHSYRLLGSLHDAEDAVQETMLRAWRRFETFQGRGSLRTWLYTIATNTSLDALKKRSPRLLPTTAYPEASILNPIAPLTDESLWLEPFPDSWLAEATENPETRYTRHESVSLAFLTALQLLPPRQRAILILSDVLDWRISEIAHLLELSVSAVTSALHRARGTLAKNYHADKQEMLLAMRANAETALLLSCYLKAWENDDVAGLVALLREDAIINMPPVPSWYRGRDAVRAILLAEPFGSGVQNRWRLYPTRANARPAFALYEADETKRIYRAHGIQVLALDHRQFPRQITEITIFHGSSLVTAFGLPSQLPRFTPIDKTIR